MSTAANPRHPNNPPSDPPAEPTGAVAKDSLANESIARGEGFSENNATAIGAKGYQSTLANEDTSNAEVLHAARSGAEREQQDFQGLGRDERGEVGIKYPDTGAGTGQTASFSDHGYRGTSGSGGTSAGARPYVESAPGYVAEQTGEAYSSGDFKPKGTNLVDGGDIPEGRDTYMGDVGGPKDPGRLAEREFQKINADASGGLGAREAASGRKGDGTAYDALNSSERA